jgi:hypothetical protein
MARAFNPQSQAIIDACKEHLMVDGTSGDWHAVRLRFPEVPRSTFFRLVEVARKQIEGSAVASDSPEALKKAQKRIRRTIDTDKVQKRIKVHLPTAPSPAVVAGMDVRESARVFDFMAYFHAVVRDADMMRNKSVRAGEDGVETLANPMLMDLSIRRRLQVMETYMASMEQLYNLERIQELYKLVVEEVGKADPAVQQAILARLRELNNRRGLTMAAQF